MPRSQQLGNLLPAGRGEIRQTRRDREELVAQPDSTAPRVAATQNVAFAISDQPVVRRSEPVFRDRRAYERGRRFTATAAGFRGVHTEIRRGHGRPVVGHQLEESLMNGIHLLSRNQTASDT